MGNHCGPGRLAVGLLLLACIILVALTFDADKIEALLVWVQENKAQGSLLFFGLYTAGVILMLPAMVMAMAAGAIFGLVAGTLLAWAGSSIGQVIAFMIGRYLLRGLVLGYLTQQFPKWTAVDRAMVTDGWKLVTLLRLSPIAPWNILNYALSVTSVPLPAYTAASSLAVLPYLVLFVYFGSLARNLADIFTGATAMDTTTTIIMGVISGTAMVGVVWYTTRISRQAVNNALMEHAEELPPELTGGDEDVSSLLGVPENAEYGEHDGLHHPHHAVAAAEAGGAGLDGGIALGSVEMTAFHGGNTPRGRQRSALNLMPNSAGGSGEEKATIPLLKLSGGAVVTSRGAPAHSSPTSSPSAPIRR